jgi:short-subunit dehydrogenase
MISDKQVAIITGASKGIGKAIAIGLARLHYQTVLVGRNAEDLQKVADIIIKNGGSRPLISRFDITNTQELKSLVKKIIAQFSHIDVLVNNAGVYFKGSVNIHEENFRKMLEVNLTAQYVFLHEIVPVMKNQQSGYIFNVASRAGKIGFSDSGAYSASKFGLVGLSESLYRELNPLGIRVTALCPGWVNTQMAVEAGTPLSNEQMIQADDIFKTMQWLLSLSPGACVKEVVLETPLNIS